MGGYSDSCPICEKWFMDRNALKQHIDSRVKKLDLHKQRRNAAIRAAIKVAIDEGDSTIVIKIYEIDNMRLSMFLDGADQALSESKLEMLATDLKV